MDGYIVFRLALLLDCWYNGCWRAVQRNTKSLCLVNLQVLNTGDGETWSCTFAHLHRTSEEPGPESRAPGRIARDALSTRKGKTTTQHAANASHIQPHWRLSLSSKPEKNASDSSSSDQLHGTSDNLTATCSLLLAFTSN